MIYPDSTQIHPLPGFPQVCFIKNTVTNPNIEIGDYTYYDDPEDSEDTVIGHDVWIGYETPIAALQDIAWWDWEIELITENLEAIVGADIDALKACIAPLLRIKMQTNQASSKASISSK